MRDSVSDRKGVLRRAQLAYERFLRLLDQYAMLSTSNQKLYERYMEARDEFSLMSGNDAAVRRDTKIKRYKQENELKLKLEVCSAALPLCNRCLHIPVPGSGSPRITRRRQCAARAASGRDRAGYPPNFPHP